MEAGKNTNIIICSSCGGKFKDTLPACPFCGSFNYKGAEAEYLEKLEDVREDVAELARIPEEETKKEFRKQGKFIGGLLVLVVAVVGVLTLLIWALNRENEHDPQELYLWKQENIPVLNELYEQEKYEEMMDFFFAAYQEDYPVYDWEHAEFCFRLDDVLWLTDMVEEAQRGEELSEYDYTDLLYYGWKMKEFERDMSDLTVDEQERLAPYLEFVLADFESRWDFTEEELEAFRKEEQENGWVTINFCEKYIKNWMKRNKK